MNRPLEVGDAGATAHGETLVSPAERRWTWAVAAVLVVLLALSAGRHQDAVSPDGVAYVELARHAMAGRADLAVSGWWSPLLVWILIPFLALIEDPLLAGHAAVAATALVFFAGCVALMRRTAVPPSARVPGTVIAALTALAWAPEVVTPDLLVAGLFALGASDLLSPRWAGERAVQWRGGLVLGMAFLAKAVALPTACLLVAATSLLSHLSGAARGRPLLRASVLTLAGIAVVALPWIGVLSVRYGRPLIAATAGPNHALVRPGAVAVERHYPTFCTLHRPEEGRLTSWEDPTVFPYPDWSPFEDAGHLRHQARVTASNVAAIAEYVASFDLLHVGLAMALLAFALGPLGGSPALPERWRWAVVPAACAAAPYTAVFALNERYHWPAYPFVLTGALGLAAHLGGRPVVRRWVVGAVAASFALGAFSWDIPGFPHSVPARPGVDRSLAGDGGGAGRDARHLAAGLAAAGAAGPVAGDRREGLYVAFFLRQPCHGQADDASPATLLACGARVIVTRRGTSLDRELAAHPRFRLAASVSPGSRALLAYVAE